MKYIVMVDDNFHYMDESERYTAGEYDTYEEAEEKCREIIRSSLEELHYDFEGWKNYGENPFVRGSNLQRHFSAWNYAEELCRSFACKNITEERPSR